MKESLVERLSRWGASYSGYRCHRDEVSLTRYMNWFRESLSLFSSSLIKKWIVVVIPICAFFMLWIGGGPQARLFGVAGYLGWLFTTGIPIIIGAVLLFGSKESQTNIADAYRGDTKKRFASLFTSYTILMLLIMSAAAVAGLAIIKSI